MATHAELAARLLREAAKFFRAIGTENPALTEQMEKSANTYESIAGLVESDPQGEVPDPSES